MRTRILTSAGAAAVTLLASAASAQPPSQYLATGEGITPEVLRPNQATIKGACPAGTTEFGNPEFSNFLSGPGGGEASDTYDVWDPVTEQYVEVEVSLTYYNDNSFDFVLTGGSVAKMLIKRSDGLLYDYSPIGEDQDTGLNKRIDGAPADDISHLEFCLSPEPPELPPGTTYTTQCVEGVSENPFGCNPSGAIFTQLGDELLDELGLTTITQLLAPSRGSARYGNCQGEFVAHDPRVDATTGDVIFPSYALDLTTLFDLTGFFPDGVGTVINLTEEAVGSPCLALVVGTDAGEVPFDFADFDVSPGGAVFTLTQRPDLVPGMHIDSRVGPLNTDASSGDFQPDMTWVEQAAYQPTDNMLLIEREASPFTFDVLNPPRLRTFSGSFYPLNTREICLNVTDTPTPPAPPYDSAEVDYFASVLQCKIDQAIYYFENLETMLREAQTHNTLISPSLNRLLRDHSRALSMIKTSQWNKAIDRLTDLRDQITGGEWIIDDFNDPGNAIMRIDNLLWRSSELAIAHAALIEMQTALQI